MGSFFAVPGENLGRICEHTMKKRCLALYSGGLDSILAVKVMQEQGIDVVAIHFATPFFSAEVLRDPGQFRQRQLDKYGITCHVVDFTDDFIHILSNPAHGYGKNLNPCVDCKIGMLKKAAALMESLDASFVVTGEVIGQRPMSQRRDAMHAIERDAGLKDILLRPLCAQQFNPTLPEREEVVDRSRLAGISGRGRKEQAALAAHFGIPEADIPTPGGGCLLTDAQISAKVRNTLKRLAPCLPTADDFMLDVVGRKFVLGNDAVVVVSRSDAENRILCTLQAPGNVFVKITGVPGPLAVLRGEMRPETLRMAAGICLRYGKGKGREGLRAVFGTDPWHLDEYVDVPVLTVEQCRLLQFDAGA